ncbi:MULTISPECIES: hypothetical protein [unclassified Variovorax]|uniref:hypothetical protein n=1 Tax=unclassified Variovorax TaxID=663243 RepID=UPI00076CA72C|nr:MULTISPECIES: hypothetical protein [unclassified Variovorax]KWT69572.1 hypothetical protein APY03_6932 [Variovorax sp. WDL1]PNG48891.1 hypothetical protein CHC06_06659 [Variovorax sp. B2]PNG49398.1 hypothetical protein CHC07_06307 [Variovorax sp. B4]VTV18298.1 hypothetical protein WDL1P2_00017 [Variovorax sp. WDL1]
MTLQAIELSPAECDELLASLSGSAPSVAEWRAVVQKAFAKGLAAASPKDSMPAVLVEPLIDIAETIAREQLVPAGDSRGRYEQYAQWAKEFQESFSRRLAAGEEPHSSYYEDIEAFTLKKVAVSGFVSMKRPVPATAVERSVFREYAMAGQKEGELEVDANAKVNISRDDPDLPPQGAYIECWTYVSNDEISGFLTRMMKDAQLDAETLDEAVHFAAARSVSTRPREEDMDLISMKASDVNNDGVDTQIQYLVARVGPEAAFQAVEAAISAAQEENEQPAPRG